MAKELAYHPRAVSLSGEQEFSTSPPLIRPGEKDDWGDTQASSKYKIVVLKFVCMCVRIARGVGGVSKTQLAGLHLQSFCFSSSGLGPSPGVFACLTSSQVQLICRSGDDTQRTKHNVAVVMNSWPMKEMISSRNMWGHPGFLFTIAGVITWLQHRLRSAEGRAPD